MPKVAVAPDIVVATTGTSSIPHVSINRVSLTMSVLFTLNLAFTPLLAYINEVFPWSVPAPLSSLVLDPFDDFNVNMTTFLQRIYNNNTFPHTDLEIFLVDTPTSSYAERFVLNALARTNDDNSCLSTMLQFPDQLYYGRKVREFVCAFLALNDTERLTAAATTSMCQHVTMVGIRLFEACLWLDPMEGTASDDASSSPSSYIVTFATYAHPHPAFAWWKLAFRVALTLYILRVAYRAYFRPYHQLLVNLRQVGLPPAAVLVDDDDAGVIPTNASIKYPKLVVVMGDPTYFVISHPLVAMVLIVDFWLSTQNFAVATSYVSQVTEWWPFLRGCVYGSKAVRPI
ncbi:Aste57867_7315 [Aphanomyces stellatus]|uniref:Aste57867_7315 protein n=1 Tax=Aphanomyces stellatus TaxID=120398 RepID=A0A485KI55_9STRA|nr:hypothetical protein As57867_007289 [Aphanomyces stellatus]VFT84234.1 Aste57867_7315 [Aphanomyces stellatus]